MTPEQETLHEAFRFEVRQAVVGIAEAIANHSLNGDLQAAMEWLVKSPETGPRADSHFPGVDALRPSQIDAIRTHALKMGIGREDSVGLSELGLPAGSNVVVEGGLPNKYAAQLQALREGSVQPGIVAIIGDPNRQLGSNDVRRMEQVVQTLDLLAAPDLTAKNELDFVYMIPDILPQVESETPVDLPIGYDLYDGGVHVLSEPTGQVRRIGRMGLATVIAVETGMVHRDDSGKNFFRAGVAHFNELTRQAAVEVYGPDARPEVVAITSDLYGATRRLQTPTLTYGRGVMTRVVGESGSAIELHQIIAEAHRAGELLGS